MATIKTFEDIEAWKKARILSNEIYELTLIGTFAKDYSLKDQINRSSGSVMDNIAEGFERNGRKEFIQFLSYAKGSVGEVRSQLYRANDRNHINTNDFQSLSEKTTEVGKMIGGLMNYLVKSDIKGTKFLEEPASPYDVSQIQNIFQEDNETTHTEL
ncbi:MAG TPA: four helix bundle protein [Chryseolinea sp.]|nr:four helix bundle protein [Chryseolinea sp.]